MQARRIDNRRPVSLYTLPVLLLVQLWISHLFCFPPAFFFSFSFSRSLVSFLPPFLAGLLLHPTFFSLSLSLFSRRPSGLVDRLSFSSAYVHFECVYTVLSFQLR